MSWLRSKKFEKHLQAVKEWTQESNIQIDYKFDQSTTIHVAQSIWDDIAIHDWIQKYFHGTGEQAYVQSILRAPINDISILKQRQYALYFFKNKKTHLLTPEIENSIRWFLKTPQFDKNYLYKVLFPTGWYIGWIKKTPYLFTLYHYYHCYLTSLSSILYPMSLILTPYYYIRYYFKYPMGFLDYLKMWSMLFIFLKKQYKVSPYSFLKIVVGIIIYVGIYIYSFIQMIDLSIQLHTFRDTLIKKIKHLYHLQQTLKQKYAIWKYPFWKAFDPTIEEEDIFVPLKPDLITLYKLFNTPSLQQKIFKLYKVCIIHDLLIRLHDLKGYKLVTYGQQTYIGSMKNPCLSDDQISNPVDVSKHLIISGPNAGGKTTYVKSLLWNILLAQTFGIVYGSYGMIKPYDAILHHHRITDIVGDKSLFQAEMQKLKETLTLLPTYQNIIYFLDEPFHSTHPIDGAAMLKSSLYYFSTKQNIRVIVTSHYFSIQDIEKTLPTQFINLSVKADVLDDKIVFDYHVSKGGSTQTIGIELLRKESFPQSILNTATKIKNKLYSHLINV